MNKENFIVDVNREKLDLRPVLRITGVPIFRDPKKN